MKSAIVLIIFPLLIFTSSAQAQWSLFPIHESDYSADPIVSFRFGRLIPDLSDASGDSLAGFEVNFNSALLAGPYPIKSQLSINRYRDETADVTIYTLESNPHFMYQLTENILIGVGPGIGYVLSDLPGRSENIWAVQIGTSLMYALNQFSVGFETRYQFTEQVRIGDDRGLDNSIFVFEVGYQF